MSSLTIPKSLARYDIDFSLNSIPLPKNVVDFILVILKHSDNVVSSAATPKISKQDSLLSA